MPITTVATFTCTAPDAQYLKFFDFHKIPSVNNCLVTTDAHLTLEIELETYALDNCTRMPFYCQSEPR